MVKALLRQPAVQALLARLIGWYLAFALGTTRWRLEGAEHLAPVLASGRAVAAFWHERLPLMPALFNHARRSVPGLRAGVLVSRHADGRLIGAVMAQFGAEAVHGSTRRKGRDRGGAAGALALLGLIERGGIAVITPDGPRGPRRVAAPGVAQLAGLSGAAVLPCSAQIRFRAVLGTWDRMVLPLPFGRGALVCAPLIAVPREGWQDALPAIAAAMSKAADRADAMVR
jgi:lysophospholipid acyltransferase (LPLAT)-like uncharacterized protein